MLCKKARGYLQVSQEKRKLLQISKMIADLNSEYWSMLCHQMLKRDQRFHSHSSSELY